MQQVNQSNSLIISSQEAKVLRLGPIQIAASSVQVKAASMVANVMLRDKSTGSILYMASED